MFGKQELNKSILKVAQESGFDGKDWTGLAEELNRRGIRTTSGRPFTPNNLRHYCLRQKVQFQIDVSVLKGSHKQNKNVSPLSSEEISNLREIISWYESRRIGLDHIERRPMFKGRTRNTGIKINEELLNRAVQKAKKERLRTGGSLSGLVELLLWKYLNEPDDLIESP
jgi:hypothetical protein